MPDNKPLIPLACFILFVVALAWFLAQPGVM